LFRSQLRASSAAYDDTGGLVFCYWAEKPLRVKSNLLNGFKLIWVVQPSLQRYIASLSPQISGYFHASRPGKRGGSRVVTNAGWDAVDAAALARKLIAGRIIDP